MSIDTQEFQVSKQTISLGEASVVLNQNFGENRLHLMIEEGAEEFLGSSREGKQTVYKNVSHQIIQNIGSPLMTFDSVLQDVAANLTTAVDYPDASSKNVHVLIVTPDTFRAIRGNSQPPAWAGVYVWWDGTVVYNAEYINSVLGDDGNFGGEHFNTQYFYEEMRHELLHSYEDVLVFGRDEEMKKHFYTNSLWYLEGLKEAMGRDISALSQDEFKGGLREILEEHPEFSIFSLSSNFWKYDTSPTNRNIAYQYSRWFMKHLARTLNEQVERARGKSGQHFKAYGGAYAIIEKAIERYREGHRESIIDVLENEFDLPKEKLKQIEYQWVEKLLKS